MGAVAIVTIKVMPESPSVDLSKIKEEINTIFVNEGGRSVTLVEQEIAFGLKAIIVTSAIPEEKGTDFFEAKLAAIPFVSSVTIEEYRRAFG